MRPISLEPIRASAGSNTSLPTPKPCSAISRTPSHGYVTEEAPHSRAKKLTRPAPAAKAPERTISPPLFKADTANLAFSADKEGRVRMVYSGWEDAKVLLPDEVLEVYWEGGQVLARKVTPVGSIDAPRKNTC